MKIYFNILLLIVLLKSGCAYHVIPMDDSYKMNPGVISSNTVFQVVFDQSGVIYPLSDTLRVLQAPDEIGNYAFTVRKYMKDSLKINHYDDEKELDTLAKRIKESLGPDTKLIILIHGFSNSIPDARGTYAIARKFITEYYKENIDYVFLQVHWDGLYHPKGRPKELISLWWKAVIYSKLVGMNGFRKLLNRFEPTTPIRILTTSRGAAVAISAFANQEISEDSRSMIKKFYDYDFESILNSKINKFTNVRMALIAPAIGTYAFDSLPKNGSPINKIIIGLNENDKILKKEFIPMLKKLKLGYKLGSTAVGCDPDVFKKLDKDFPNLFVRVEFKDLDEHDGGLYLKNTAFRKEVLPQFLKD
ncbi:MAG: hypothetical protein IIA61_09985 [Candidatus Marinimicrobia bacterium]|nr:hypothetical protein [Candidatus Neomarinimicrobiota bacterium]